MIKVLQVSSGNADAGETFRHSVSFGKVWKSWKSLEDPGEQLLSNNQSSLSELWVCFVAYHCQRCTVPSGQY